MLTDEMTSRGLVTVPKEVCDHLGVKAGDGLHFTIEKSGRVIVEVAKVSIMDLKGILPKPLRPVTLEEMGEGIAEGTLERYRCSREF